MQRSFIEYVMRMRDGVTPDLRKMRSEAKRTDRSMTDLKGTIGTFVGLAGIGFAATQLARLGGELTKVEKSFEVLVGNKQEAESLLANVSEYAKTTNFGKMGLAQSAKDLLTYGVAAKDVMPTLKMLGDVSLGNQERLKLLSFAYSQVQGAGKLMGQDLLQLINSGFNPLQIISRETGKSMGELRDMMREGAISAEMVTQAMKMATSEGGRFFNGAMALADTGAGRYDRMKETALELAQTFGQDLLEAGRPLFDLLTSMFEFIAANKDIFLVLASVLGTVTVGLLAASGAMSTFNALVGILNVLAAANPFGLIVLGISALVAGLVVAYKRFDQFREVVDGVWGSLKQFGSNIRDWVTNPIKNLKELLGSTIAPFMEAIGLAQSGNFLGAAKALGRGIVGLNPVGMMANAGLFDGMGGAYQAAANASKAKSAAEPAEKAGSIMDNIKGAAGFDFDMDGAGDGSKGSSLKSGLNSISGRAPKTFNINISRMIGIESLNTTNIQEGLEDLEDQVRRVLLNALNDSQNMAAS